MSSTHRLIASIRDIGSKNGMYLNEEELDYDNHSCKANDIITIGKCYKLIMLLVDAEQLGLSVAEDFADGRCQPQRHTCQRLIVPYPQGDFFLSDGILRQDR